MGRLISAISDFANEAFSKPQTTQVNNEQLSISPNNISNCQYPNSSNNFNNAPSYPYNSNNNVQYANNVNNNGLYFNNGQYSNNSNNNQNLYNYNNAQYAFSNNNGQFSNNPNNQQNSYNMDPNQQDPDGSANGGKKATARSGFIEFGLPIILRYALEDSLGLVWASVISSVPIILSMLFSIFVKKMFTPFSLIMLTSIYVDLVFQLAFKSERLQLLSGTVVSGLIALVCFVTIPFNNIFIYYLAKPAATGGDHEKCIEFDEKWKLPPVRKISTRISIGVGIGFLLAAGLNAVIVFILPSGMINIGSIVVSIGSAAVITAWATWYKTRKTNELLALQSEVQQVTSSLSK